MEHDYIYLASASARRRALLDQVGVPYQVRTVPVDERRLPEEDPETLVRRLALAKADALSRTLRPAERRPVLAADTAVVVERDVLGKPRDREDGLSMLEKLSGKTHSVFTAVALIDEDRSEARVSQSQVQFRALLPGEPEAYWNTGEPIDKAGSYAIQGRAAIFVSRLEGSYSGVMGLPLFEAAALLREAGIDIWRGA